MEILFLAHRVPFPPDRGDRIRSYNVLKHLAARATVHLVALADDETHADPPPRFRALVDECHCFVRRRSRVGAAATAMLRRTPASVEAFADARVGAVVRDILARRTIGAVYAFSGQMAQYLPRGGPRAVMDFVDLDSAKYAAYAHDHSGPLGRFYAREGRLLAQYERQVAARVNASVFVSAAETRLLPGSVAIENGIDTEAFDPAARFVHLAPSKPLIVFTGQMDYRPNIDAVTWFARDILPAVRARHPGARFAIVGRDAPDSVRALASESVTVTGEVPDVRGWLAAADVVVAPLKLARGIQNKVLEAMAMARPVVASAAAAEGLDHGGTIRVAADAGGLAAETIALLDDPGTAARLGRQARAQVIARYGWDARLAPLDALLGLEGRAEQAA